MFKRTQPTSTTLRRTRRAALALAAIVSLAVPAASVAVNPIPEPPNIVASPIPGGQLSPNPNFLNVAKPDPSTGLVAFPDLNPF